MDKKSHRMSAAVNLSHVSHRFLQENGKLLEVFRDLSLEVRRNECLAVIGTSGCGKSTLLSIVSGLLQPSQGKVVLKEKNISMVFQSPTLFPWLTLEENVMLPLSLKKSCQSTSKGAAMRILERVSLTGFERSYPDELSGGMRIRGALARALVTRPNLLLLDEPFSALDRILATKLSLELSVLLEEQKVTTILVTHDIEQAVLLSDRVIVLGSEPTEVVADIAVPLPRPRSGKTLDDEAFHSTVLSIRSALGAILNSDVCR